MTEKKLYEFTAITHNGVDVFLSLIELTEHEIETAWGQIAECYRDGTNAYINLNGCIFNPKSFAAIKVK